MLYLISASLIWSFSFGLIKGNLTSLDPNFVSFVRILLSFFIFLPFIRIKGLGSGIKLKLLLTGAVQYGFMYIAYISSYKFLKGYEVAIFTIFTPVYISLIHDIKSKKLHSHYLIISLLAVSGTALIVYKGISSSAFLPGFFLLQLSNIFFAWGQVQYREIMKERNEIEDKGIFAYLYLGALLVTLFSTLITTDLSTLTLSGTEALTLLYLGTIPSGIAFFLWNYGVRRTGIGTISIFNNLKIPFAVIISIIVFGERGDLFKIFTGCIILISALVYNEIKEKSRKRKSLSPVSGK